jgi:hypothetical protein
MKDPMELNMERKLLADEMTIPEQQKKIREIKRRFEREWIQIKGVAAVGIGTIEGGNIGIIISVESNTAHVQRLIPHEVEGVKIEIKTTGIFKAEH